MSDDKRLGADPLGWIGNAAGAGRPEVAATEVDGPVDSGNAAPAETESCAPVANPGLVYERILFPGPGPDSEVDMGKSRKVKLEQDMEAAEAVAHLEDFVESMKSGQISAESAGETLSIPVPGSVSFEMKLSRKKDKAKCSFELEWHIDPEEEKAVKITGKCDCD